MLRIKNVEKVEHIFVKNLCKHWMKILALDKGIINYYCEIIHGLYKSLYDISIDATISLEMVIRVI